MQYFVILNSNYCTRTRTPAPAPAKSGVPCNAERRHRKTKTKTGSTVRADEVQAEHFYFPRDHVVDDGFWPVLREYSCERFRCRIAVVLDKTCQMIKIRHATWEPVLACWCGYKSSTRVSTANTVCKGTPSELFAHAYSMAVELMRIKYVLFFASFDAHAAVYKVSIVL